MEVNATFISLVLLGAYFVYVGWRSARLAAAETDAEGQVASGLLETVASLFAVIGAGEYALLVTLILAYGFTGSSFLVGLACALFVASYFVPRIWKVSTAEDSPATFCGGYRNFTTPDFLHYTFGSLCSVPASLIGAVAFWALLVMQFTIGGKLMSGLAGVPYWQCVLLMAIVVTVYLISGGLAAIFHTDIYQKGLMWVGLVVAIGYVFSHGWSGTGIESSADKLVALTREKLSGLDADPTVVTVFLVTLVAAFAGPDIWQRINTPATAEAAKRSLRLAAFATLLFIIPVSLLTVHIRAVVPEDGDKETEPLLAYVKAVCAERDEATEAGVSSEGDADGAKRREVPGWPSPVIIVFAIGFLSAFVSTADTSAMLVATIIQNEWRRQSRATRRATGPTQQRSTYVEKALSQRFTAITVLAVGAIGALFAVFLEDVANFFTGVLGLLAAVGLPTFLALVGFGNRGTCFVAMVVGSMVALVLTYGFHGEFNTGYYLLLPVAPGILGFLSRRTAAR